MSYGFISWHPSLELWGIALPAPLEGYWISPLLDSDAPALMSIFDDPRMRSRLYRQPISYTLAYAQTLIDRNKGLEFFYETLRSSKIPIRLPDNFFGCLRDEHDQVIATMDLSPRAFAVEKRYIGFFLHCDLHGKGIISLAAKRMLDALDAHNGRELIYGVAREDNAGSQRILKKLGFVERERFEVQYPADKGGGTRRVIEYARDT